jgi:hypothetical protein
MNRQLAVSMIMTLAVCAGHAQETLSGSWEGETRNGASLVLTLKVEGTSLTGTLVRSRQRATLSDGAASKNTFTFKATLNGQTEAFSGEATGNEIKIWMDRQGASDAIVLRRAKRK